MGTLKDTLKNHKLWEFLLPGQPCQANTPKPYQTSPNRRQGLRECRRLRDLNRVWGMMLNYAYHGNLTYTTFTRSPHDSVRSYLESADDEGQALAVVGLCKAQVARCKSSREHSKIGSSFSDLRSYAQKPPSPVLHPWIHLGSLNP